MTLAKILKVKLLVGQCGLLALLGVGPARAQRLAFRVVPLGVKGGLAEGNLSAYLVAAAGSPAYVGLDAGSLRPGLVRAVATGALTGPVEALLRDSIKGYCLSHVHLDHVAGLLLNAPADAPKPIYGLPACLATLQNDYLNWRAWPNFGDGGAAPALGQYALRTLVPGQPTPLAGTPLSVRAYPLSHGRPYQSAAFLVRSGDSYLLYLGDTGADDVEQSHCLRDLWRAVAPLLRQGQLRVISIEASYPNTQPDNRLFGHLTPALLLGELDALGRLAGPAALRGLPVVITHLKPTAANEALIRRQLAAGNRLGVRLVFPVQGERLAF